MKILYRQNQECLPQPAHKRPVVPGTELRLPTLLEDIQKTRSALEIAYAGFDNAVDEDMIDCYIYEINSLYKRYRHLSRLVETEQAAFPQKKLSSAASPNQSAIQIPSPVKALLSHVLG